jgi:hypothetical protein
MNRHYKPDRNLTFGILPAGTSERKLKQRVIHSLLKNREK